MDHPLPVDQEGEAAPHREACGNGEGPLEELTLRVESMFLRLRIQLVKNTFVRHENFQKFFNIFCDFL